MNNEQQDGCPCGSAAPIYDNDLCEVCYEQGVETDFPDDYINPFQLPDRENY